MKGIIALDIDGTITKEINFITSEVANFLDDLQKEGWMLLFITGRNFPWAYRVLNHLTKPYILAVQNGAILLEMPSQKILERKYLDTTIFPALEEIGKEFLTDFILFSGYEYDDVCYFRSKNFSEEHLNYLNRRKNALQEVWVDLPDFSDLPFKEFASLKFIEKKERALKIVDRIEGRIHLHAPLNRDPFDSAYSVAQITHPKATKGCCLTGLIEQLKWKGPVIAAGDDRNDKTMLDVANIRVVMADAPKELLAIADVIAPPAEQNGIIQGLTHAIQMAKI